MKRALTLAKRGKTSPNPMVGAVIVKDGLIIGEGYHKKAGEPHAEVNAILKAGDGSENATMYVTLEPCRHFGRTPPCTKAIIEAGISQVFVAMTDPDEKMAGKGIADLIDAGIKVVSPFLEDEAKSVNEAYITHRTTGLPLVILKSALSLDGKIATKTGDSKWITNEKSRGYAHKIRSMVDAVIVGANTAKLDDPKLSARLRNKTIYPKRVIISSKCDLVLSLNVFNQPGEVIVITSKSAVESSVVKLKRAGVRILLVDEIDSRPSILQAMKILAEEGCLSVLIEGGGELAAAAFKERVVNKILYFYAPKIIGGDCAVGSVGGDGIDLISSAIQIADLKYKKFGSDLAIEGRVVYPR